MMSYRMSVQFFPRFSPEASCQGDHQHLAMLGLRNADSPWALHTMARSSCKDK